MTPIAAHLDVEIGDITVYPGQLPPTYQPGDTDTDMDVDSTDLGTLGLNWDPSGTTHTWAEGDFDGNGNVNSTDLAAVGINWAPGGYTMGQVPEPMTVGMLCLGVAGLLLRRRR